MLIMTLLVIVSIAVLVYWVKSLIIMSSNTLFLILGIFFSPFVQIGYFFSQRDEMDDDQATTMKRYFIVMGVYIVVFIFAMGSLMSQFAQGQAM